MIEQIFDASKFDEWQQRDIFTVRILALLKSYGCQYQFACFYRQIIDGKITAILSRLDNNYSLSVTDGFDNEELVHFFCITGYQTIAASDKFYISDRFEKGIIMSSTVKNEIVLQNAEIDEYPKLIDLYNFVDYENQDFKAWYVDISHRVRHHTAKAYTLNVDGAIVSSGILSSIIDGYAILSAVRTADSQREKGYGSALVNYICNDVNGEVLLVRDEHLNESFYQKLGFKNIGNWRMYK